MKQGYCGNPVPSSGQHPPLASKKRVSFLFPPVRRVTIYASNFPENEVQFQARNNRFHGSEDIWL
jgi:hypothetical protein